MTARRRVLSDIRDALKQSAFVGSQLPSFAPVKATSPAWRPEIGPDLVSHFSIKAKALSCTVDVVETENDLPAAVETYLNRHQLPKKILVAESLLRLGWPDTLSIQHSAALPQDLVSVTPCFAGIAETGSMVFVSSPASPTSLNFVPDDHVVVLRESQIVAHMEDVWSLLREISYPMARTVNIISGPSRTADVEQTVQLGVHGPRRVHIILLRS